MTKLSFFIALLRYLLRIGYGGQRKLRRAEGPPAPRLRRAEGGRPDFRLRRINFSSGLVLIKKASHFICKAFIGWKTGLEPATS